MRTQLLLTRFQQPVLNGLMVLSLLTSATGCCMHRGWYGYGQQAPCGPCSGGGASFYAPQGGCANGQCAPSFGAPASTYTVPQGAYYPGGVPQAALPAPAAFSTAMLPADPLPTY